MIRTIDTSPVRIPSGAPSEAWSMSPKRLLPSNDTPNVQAGNQSTESTVAASTVSPIIAEPTSPAQPEKPEPDDDEAKFTTRHTEGESKGYEGPGNNTPPQGLTPKNAGRKCSASGSAFCRFRQGRPETSPPVPLATSDLGSEESKQNEETGVRPSTTVCRICFCVALLAILGIFIIIGVMRMSSNKYDDYVCHEQTNGSCPSTPDDSQLCPSPSLDVKYLPTTSTHPTQEPALDSNAAAGEAAAERAEEAMDVEKKSGFSLPPHLTSQNPHAGTSRIQSEISCWIYMHMDKSGTNVVRNIVTERWQRDQRSFDSAQWRRGDDYAADVMTNSRWRLLHGGCVEALRRYEVDRGIVSDTGLKQESSCAWFTVFRNPVARMISAFDHCQKATRDPLCGPVQATDLEHFAEYWGNFCLRQFAMSLVLWSDVKGWAARPGGPRDRSSTWYLLKQYFDRQGSGGEISEEMLLEPMKQILSTAYTAIGIEEDMEATMILFNKVLVMPDVDWVSSLRDHSPGEHDGDVVEAGRVELALANPRIVDALKLDILLYEYAVAIFQEQVAL